MNSKVFPTAILAIASSISFAVYPDRHALNPSFPTVGRFIFSGSGLPVVVGSCVAISDHHAITARHVFAGPGSWSTNVDNKFVQFGSFSDQEPGEQGEPPPQIEIVAAYHSPAQFGFNFSDDLTVLVFPTGTFKQWSKFSTATNLIGQDVTVVGYGVTANHPFASAIANSEGIKRYGTNKISAFYFDPLSNGQYHQIRCDIDGNGIDFYGDGGPTTYECGVASGDSGGPTFITENGELKIVGIHGGATFGYGGLILDHWTKNAYELWIQGFLPAEWP